MRLCIFCGSKSGNKPIYAETARDIGRLLADQHIGLVYGGGNIGLMGVLADAVLTAGGEVVGVIPGSMVDRELAHGGLSELHIVDTMHARKALMAEKADAFLAIPGGYGTLEEFFEMVTWGQLGLHHKPLGLLNIAGFFDPLIQWIDRAFADSFIAPRHRGLIRVSTNAEELISLLTEQRN